MKSSVSKNKSKRKVSTSLSNLFIPQNSVDRCLEQLNTMPAVKQNMFYSELIVNNSMIFHETPFITSENFHALNRISSHKLKIHSTSTLFYDLDQIAKRHSYHCITDRNIANAKPHKNIKKQENQNGFIAKSEAIVQECATNIKPTLKTRNSLEINANKLKKLCNVNDPNLSSDILLKDEDNSYYYQKEPNNHKQKLWSYAKYRTEYTNPITSGNKGKKKDSGKRTEDPCPCQLFSYACPCTNKKSLTELASNSKSITVLDQMTSTSKITNYEYKSSKQNKSNEYSNKENKQVCEHDTEYSHKFETITSDNVARNEKQDSLKSDNNSLNLKNNKARSIENQKRKQVQCPNCKEIVDLTTTTEDEDSLKSKNSPVSFKNSIYTEENQTSWIKNRQNILVDNDDACIHNPPCELIPVCQILPVDHGLTTKCRKPQQADVRPNPRSIRITKACRHHPPCTVVPSCQRINVLRNNCEFIPPCLHRPRCINLPLCVPISKTMDYNLLHKHINDVETAECVQASQCKHFFMCQHDLMKKSANPEFHTPENTCEYLNEHTPRFIINSNIPCMSPTFSPCQVPQNLTYTCNSDKSCQYNAGNSRVSIPKKFKSNASSEAVIYIRDVGCQFQNKNIDHGDSLIRSKNSSNFFDLVDKKEGNYITTIHAHRYEDKFTNPTSGQELSMSTVSTSSLDVGCPSHAKQRLLKQNELTSGFNPQTTNSPYVGVLTTNTNNPKELSLCRRQSISKTTSTDTENYCHFYDVKPRRSSLRPKYKNVFSSRRRRKPSSHVFNTARKISCYKKSFN